MRVLLFGVLLGALFLYIVQGMFEKRLPDAFEIEREGKVIGYADTDFTFAEFVKIEGKGVKSPGMFIAFPIYGNSEEF